MAFPEEQKKLLAKQIVDIFLQGLESGELSEEDPPVIADIFLNRLDTLTSAVDAAALLQELAAKWPIFVPLAQLKAGEHKEAEEAEVAEGVLTLAQHGKIDEAIKLAKSATESA